jgi:antitoxin component of RelBE/YafQ-DinJ toxin-antitoxin module
MEKDWALRRKGIYREYLVLRVPFEIKRKLQKVAKRKKLSVSDLVRLSIERLLNEEDLEKV